MEQSWRIRLNALPTLVVFFYRNLLSISNSGATQVVEVFLDCLGDENVEVREMASKALSGVVRCSQRQSIIPLKVCSTFKEAISHLRFDLCVKIRIDSSAWLERRDYPHARTLAMQRS